jgi:exonuclease SbcC
MFISKLHLKNFRNHSDTKLDLDRLTVIVGANASGKSSIAEAISILLTGECERTSEAKIGMDEPIRTGQREFYLSGVLATKPDPTLLERTRDRRSQTIAINKNPVPAALAQQQLCEALAPLDVLAAVLDSARFMDMDDKSQKTLLASVLAADAPVIPKEVLDDMNIFRDGASTPITTIAHIDFCHKAYYDLRTETNREIKALGSMEAPEAADPDADPKKVWKQLDDLRKELETKQTTRTRVDERYRSEVSANKIRRGAIDARKTAAKQMMLSKPQCDELEAICLNEEKATGLQAKLGELTKKITAKLQDADRSVTGAVAKARQVLAGIQSQIEEKEAAINHLLAIKKPECPMCARALSAEDKSTLGMKLDAEVSELHKKEQSAITELREAAKNPESKELTDMRTRLTDLQAQLTALGDVAAASASLRNHRQLMVDYGHIDRELVGIKDPDVPDFTTIDAEIAKLNTRIGNGEAVWNEVCKIEGEQKAYVVWKEKKSQLESRVVILERLIAFFGPNGIKAKMVGDKIGPFTQTINSVLSHFGYSVEFSIEPYAFIVNKNLALRQLSESERFRFGVAFQIALAMATGLKFVVVDGADILQESSRGELIQMLLESDLDQAIVLSTSEKEVPGVVPDGMKFIALGQRQAVAA